MFETQLQNIRKRRFLFEELVKRDFKQKYKRTVLGMGWSILSPLLTLLVFSLVFSVFFGQTIPHYTIYLFCGNLLFAYFREATSSGMGALMQNAHIFTKINVPKYIFVLTKNVSSLANFGLTLCVFFLFVLFEPGLLVTWKYIFLLFPIACLIALNIGIGMFLSAVLVFFRDMRYLYDVFIMLLMYVSAIFYPIDIVPTPYRYFFYGNPVYCYIAYFRDIILDAKIPSLEYHLLCLAYAIGALAVGCWFYRKYNYQFLYYL